MISPGDEVAALIAGYAVGVNDALDEQTRRATKNVLMDAIAVGMGALRHRASIAARQYAYRIPAGDDACLIWGTSARTDPQTAALVNGVLLRCYDYNDLYMGKCTGGHPSDMIPGLIAVAEWTNASGAQLLSAIALGYEVTLALLDTLPMGPGGWDYANLTAIGAVCATSRLLSLTREQVEHALAITVIPHLASDEIESGELNKRGDLTMWKRFNGGDAIRQAVYAAMLASAGVEGVVRPFTGRLGFLAKLQAGEDLARSFRDHFTADRALSRVRDITMKRWPVGSRAQSAIQAALKARSKLRDPTRIREIRVLADDKVYDHLVRIRKEPWHPFSRETADHSLPYIVASAILDGYVTTQSFEPSRVLDPDRQSIVQKVKVAPGLRNSIAVPSTSGAATFLARVEIETLDGEIAVGEPLPPPGHPDNPFSDADLEAKLHEAIEPIEKDRATHVTEGLQHIERFGSIREFTKLLSLSEGGDIDSTIAD